MPTYMQSGYLKDAINSVLRQTYSHFELIIIDNYSTDGSDALVSSYRDSRIRYYKFRNEGIIAASRNFGIGLAYGRYVAFLDSDDIWDPRKLEESINALASGSDFICHNMKYFNGNGLCYIPSGCSDDVTKDPLNSLLTIGNFINTSTVVTRRELLGSGFSTSQDIVTAEDYDLWLTIFSNKKYRCTYLRLPLASYRIHGTSNSSQAEAHAAATLQVIRKWHHMRRITPSQLKVLEATVWRSIGRLMYNKGKRQEALRFCMRSLIADYVSLKSWLFLFSFIFPASTVAFIQSRIRP
jgi:glycosyltransferase involved in cell wall biosynthesis